MKYLITGGTGSFGKHYVQWLTDNTNAEIVVFSRCEYKQWEMRKQFPDVEYIIGDIRDQGAINNAMNGVDYIVHAAALKHVRTGEVQPWETIRTNIEGTRNVVTSVKYANIGAKMVLLSTDKAVEPVNLYGASKMIAERLVIAGGQRVTRYGNIFGSRGSVLHIFKEQAAQGDLFTITDRRMTRFIVTFDEAIKLVNKALDGDPGIYLPTKIRGINITDLALAFDDKAKFTEIGIQPGEKMAELLSSHPLISSEDCTKLSVYEIRRLIDGI